MHFINSELFLKDGKDITETLYGLSEKMKESREDRPFIELEKVSISDICTSILKIIASIHIYNCYLRRRFLSDING